MKFNIREQIIYVKKKREMILFQDLGNLPLVMIRFNPDKYKINNKTIKGCFYYKKNRLKYYKKKLNDRLEKLYDRIDYYLNLNDFPEKEFNCEYLFYDIEETSI